MSHTSTQDIIDKKLKQYNEEEFYSLINISDNQELIKPIKKNSKKFIQDTKGWRIEKLDKNKLKEIYFKYAYKKREPNLSVNLVSLINKNSIELIKIIESKLGDIQYIESEINNNNKVILDELIDFLLESNYGEDIMLCLKLIEIKLEKEIISYIEEIVKYKKLIKSEKKKITNDITIEFNNKLKENEKKYNEAIKMKEKEIKELNLNICNINKKCKLEIEEKKIEILKLKENNRQKEMKFNLESEKLNKKIVKLEEKLDKFEIKQEEYKILVRNKDEEIDKLSYLLENKYDNFEKYAKERWESEHEELNLRNIEIENSIRELELYKKCIEKEVCILKKDKEEIENTINSLEKKSEEFINNISYVMNRISKVEECEKNIAKTKSEEFTSINHIKSILIEENPEIKEDKFDFIDELADNFECIGISNDYTYELAKYIYATITNKMGLFVMGYNSRLFADAISYIINNSTAEKIIVPPGFTDSEQLINIINESESKVLLIENAIDSIPENVYMPLLKENQDKILIFSMESNENINIIPKSVFNYLMVVDLDLILESGQREELYACETSHNIFKLSENNQNKNIRKSSKLFKSLDAIIDLSNISKIKMLEINNIIDNLHTDKNIKDGIYSLLLFYIVVISKKQGRYEQIEKFIKEQDFDREKLDNLDFIIGMGRQDEQ